MVACAFAVLLQRQEARRPKKAHQKSSAIVLVSCPPPFSLPVPSLPSFPKTPYCTLAEGLVPKETQKDASSSSQPVASLLVLCCCFLQAKSREANARSPRKFKTIKLKKIEDAANFGGGALRHKHEAKIANTLFPFPAAPFPLIWTGLKVRGSL